MTVKRGVSTLTTVTAAGDGTFTAPVTLLAGVNTFTATATDVAGNLSATSTTFVVTLDNVAPAAPSIAKISNDTGASSSDRITNQAAQTLTGSAEASSTVTIRRGDSTIGSGSAGGDGAWAIEVALVEGGNPLAAVATDAAGNSSVASTELVITLDTTMPQPALTSISADTGSSDSDRITKVADQTLSGTAEPGSVITVVLGRSPVATTTAGGDGTFSVAVTLVEGRNTYAAISEDVAGNSATSPLLDVVLDTTVDAPTWTAISDDTGLSNNDQVTNQAAQTVTGSAEPGSRVVVGQNGASAGSVTANDAGQFSIDVTLVDGTNTFVARTTDLAGNTSPNSAAFDVHLDATAPEGQIVSPPDGWSGNFAQFRNLCGGRGDYSICGTAIDQASGYVSGVGQLGLDLTLTGSPSTCLNESGNFTEAACSAPLAVTLEQNWARDTQSGGPPKGDYTARLTTTDVAGNVSTHIVRFTIR